VVFDTEDACCTHMVEVHSLLDFNTDSVRDGHGNKELSDKLQKDDLLDKPRPSRAVRSLIKANINPN